MTGTMKRYFALLITVLVIGLPAKAQEPLTPEVNRMIEYLMLADEAGLNVPLYIMELSDQLAMLSLTNKMNKEIMEQGAAAAELYAHPLVCMNYAAPCLKVALTILEVWMKVGLSFVYVSYILRVAML